MKSVTNIVNARASYEVLDGYSEYNNALSSFKDDFNEFDIAMKIEDEFGPFEVNIDESMFEDPYQKFLCFSDKLVSIHHPNLIFTSNEIVKDSKSKSYEIGPYTAYGATIRDAIRNYLNYCICGYKIRYRNPKGDGYATTKIVNFILSSGLVVSINPYKAIRHV